MRPDSWSDRLPIPTKPDGSLDLESESLLAAVEEHKRNLRLRARSLNTSTAYANDWGHFLGWCELAGIRVVDFTGAPVIERAMLVYLAYYLHHPDRDVRLSPQTMKRRIAGIKASMGDLGLPFPTYNGDSPLNASINVARRELNPRSGKAAAISERLITQMSNACDVDTPKGRRDQALLLLGFCGAFRRSELIGLDLENLSFEEDGMVVHIRRSKTDQEGQGRDVYIPYGKHAETCPVRAVQRWIDERGGQHGPFLTSLRRGGRVQSRRLNGAVVDRVVKEYTEKVGARGAYSAHSLRSGLATSAAKAGANVLWIKRQTGHKSTQSVEGYIQAGTGFADNVMRYLDL